MPLWRADYGRLIRYRIAKFNYLMLQAFPREIFHMLVFVLWGFYAGMGGLFALPFLGHLASVPSLLYLRSTVLSRCGIS
jgi:hypothetical protein